MQNVLFYKAIKWMERYQKPVVVDECCYEGDIHFSWGNISAKEMTNRFWCAYCVGAFATHGETYLSDDDVLWWAKGGVLRGQSPDRIAFLREIIESFPGDNRGMSRGICCLGKNPVDMRKVRLIRCLL